MTRRKKEKKPIAEEVEVQEEVTTAEEEVTTAEEEVTTAEEEVTTAENVPDPALGRMTNAAEALSKSFKEKDGSFNAVTNFFVSIKSGLKSAPADVPKLLEELADKYPNLIDHNALRYDQDWGSQKDKREAYNALIILLMIKKKNIKPYFMVPASLKGMLSTFGDNGHYLYTLYTEV